MLGVAGNRQGNGGQRNRASCKNKKVSPTDRAQCAPHPIGAKRLGLRQPSGALFLESERFANLKSRLVTRRRRWSGRVLDCGGKRIATPLSRARSRPASWITPARPKAPSPPRFAGAVQKTRGVVSVQGQGGQRPRAGYSLLLNPDSGIGVAASFVVLAAEQRKKPAPGVSRGFAMFFARPRPGLGSRALIPRLPPGAIVGRNSVAPFPLRSSGSTFKVGTMLPNSDGRNAVTRRTPRGAK
jgi:hypothetical protein